MAIIKPFYNTIRSVLGDVLPVITPFSVIIDASEKCNFKCNYCFRGGDKNHSWSYAASNENMSVETFNLIINQLSRFPDKIKTISLSNHGEPLCNPNLAEMANKLQKAEIAQNIEIHTNASLLYKHDIKKLAQSGLTRIIVSLQGLNAATYKKICKADITWDVFISNLKLLYKYKSDNLKIHIKISQAALDENNFEQEKQQFFNAFSEMADFIFVEKVVPLWEMQKNQTLINQNKFGDSFGQINYCPLLFYKLIIAPNGDIYPCTNLPPLKILGNINLNSITDVWSGKERLVLLKNHLIESCSFKYPCKQCYIPVNTVVTENDIIDPYKNEILQRLEVHLNNV